MTGMATCNMNKVIIAAFFTAMWMAATALCAQVTPQPQDTLQVLQTRYARVRIDRRGFITSIVSLQTGKEYNPAGHPSPLMSLHDYKQPYSRLLFPAAAAFDAGNQEIQLQYPNGA